MCSHNFKAQFLTFKSVFLYPEYHTLLVILRLEIDKFKTKFRTIDKQAKTIDKLRPMAEKYEREAELRVKSPPAPK